MIKMAEKKSKKATKKDGGKEKAKKSEKKEAKRALSEAEVAKSWKILSFPHTTEKSIGLIEKENTLVFVVDRRANKSQIKNAVENALGAKVESIRTLITQDNMKKAYVKLGKGSSASEIAIRMGII